MATTETTLVERITDYLDRFMVFYDEDYALLIALWIIHTWTHSPSFPRSPFVTPYLYVFSEEPACGKSTLIEAVESLVLNPVKTADISAAAMFRMIGGMQEDDEEGTITARPTLFVDEMDTVFNGGSKHDSLRNTLNSGYKESGYTIRVSGKTAERFPTFCPKLLAGIRRGNVELPETVRTRSIPIKLTPGQPTEIYYNFMHGEEAQEIADEIQTWVTAKGEEIIGYMPQPGGALERRPFEVAFTLLQLAHFLGCEERTREALARLLTSEAPPEAPEMVMFRTIHDLFMAQEADKLHSATIAEALGGWSTKHLSQMLRPFGIRGNNTMSIDGKPAKGYWRSQFIDTWRSLGIVSKEEE